MPKMSLKIDIHQVETNLKKMENKLINLKALTSAIASLMKTASINEFDTEGQGEWAPRKKTTKKNAGKPILTDTAQLRNSIQAQSTDTTAIVGSNKIYLPTHQFGDEKRNIPARPPLIIRKELEEAVNDLIKNHFQ